MSLLTLLIIVAVIVAILALIGGPRYYRGRRTVVREYDV
jgi:hypothetical protein